MKLIQIITLVTMFAFVSIAAGCGKKDGDGKKKGTSAQKVKPGDKKPTEPPKTPVADSAADVEAGLVVTEKFADVVAANKDDCAKLGAEITKFYEANKDAVEKGKKFATAMTPEAAAEYDTKYAARIAVFAPKMASAAKCMADPSVVEAMKLMTPEARPKVDPTKAEPVKADPAKAEPAKKAP